ncbi:MAG: AMP-binding protein, partial [Thermodesulfobacteriota bacterium]|nr:AMP-binding protein [Thermodesulfobacteriota bacterium]
RGLSGVKGGGLMTGLTADQTTPRLFLNRVALHPDHVAMREKHLGVWNEITWSEYQRHVEDFCLGLISLGLEPGDKACIHGENTQEWMYADLAIQSAGGVSVGIYPTNPAAEVQYIAGHCDARIYVAQDQEQADKIIQVKDSLPHLKKIVAWDMRGIWSYDEPLLISFKEVEELGRRLKEKQPGLFMERVNSGRPDDDALIIYTSGTTGPPKGAVHTHRSFLTGAKGMADFFELREEDHFLSYLPLCHAAERLFSVYMPLFSGAVISFAESTQTVQRDLVDVSPTFLALMPRILEKMRAGIKVKIDESTLLKRQLYKLFLAWGYEIAGKEMKDKPLPFLWKVKKLAAYYGLFRPLQDKQGLLQARRAVCGGAAVGPDLVAFFRAIGVPITQIYGQTEGLIIFAPAEDDIKTDTVGKNPFEGVTWMLSEENEILWKWGGVFKGYYKDEAVTKETIDEDGWLHSGDIGQLDEDGHLKIVDRKKNIIITSGGKNITPEYIENKLKSSPYIADAIIIGEARPFLTALIQIDFDVVSHWAETKKLAYTTLRDLSRNQAVIDLVSGIVTEVNKTLARVEEVKKFSLIDIELDHETGELTATMKVKRNVIDKKFGAEIEKMYKRRVKK